MISFPVIAHLRYRNASADTRLREPAISFHHGGTSARERYRDFAKAQWASEKPLVRLSYTSTACSCAVLRTCV